jgi:hypothetical protein
MLGTIEYDTAVRAQKVRPTGRVAAVGVVGVVGVVGGRYFLRTTAGHDLSGVHHGTSALRGWSNSRHVTSVATQLLRPSRETARKLTTLSTETKQKQVVTRQRTSLSLDRHHVTGNERNANRVGPIQENDGGP